jgi:hypothetical protein
MLRHPVSADYFVVFPFDCPDPELCMFNRALDVAKP